MKDAQASARPPIEGDVTPPPLAVRLLKAALRIAIGVLIGATLFLVIFERQLIYFPAKGLDFSPASIGLAFEDVTLDVEPGVAVHGWFIHAARKPARATVLFSHGNAGNIGDRLDRIREWRELNVDVFLYDYRGFGRSTGQPDEAGTYRDVRAAYDYLTRTRGVDPARLVIMGESLGCAVSVDLATDHRAAGLILEAPFASIPHMARAIYPFLPVGPLVRTRYDNLAKIPSVALPLLVVQGTRDEVIPIAQGRMVFDAAREPKQFLPIDLGHHNDVYLVGGSRYRDAVAAFIDRVTPALVESPKR